MKLTGNQSRTGIGEHLTQYQESAYRQRTDGGKEGLLGQEVIRRRVNGSALSPWWSNIGNR